MSEPAGSDVELEDIRREMDAIDDGLVNLLERRFAATEHVRAIKLRNGGLGGSAFRPVFFQSVRAPVLRRAFGPSRTAEARGGFRPGAAGAPAPPLSLIHL